MDRFFAMARFPSNSAGIQMRVAVFCANRP
jgi:hypothetical protein